MLAILFYPVLALTILYIILRIILGVTQSKDEPPVLANGIPFLSSIYGMSTKGMGYFKTLRDTYNLPIYTLRFPGFRLYVVNSPSLVGAIHKPGSQTVAWGPILGDIAANMMGLSQPTVEMLRKDLGPDGSFMKGFHKAMHVALDPKTEGLDKLGERAIYAYSASLDNDHITKPVKAKLFDFLKRHGTLAVSEAVFGPHNPYRDPKMEGFYNEMETGLFQILLGLAPHTAPSSLQARETLVAEYTKYFSSNHHLDPEASVLLRSRHEFYTSYGIPQHEIPRIETILTATLLGNSRPTTFWLLWHLLSDPDLLSAVREELLAAMVDDGSSPEGTTPTKVLNTATLKSTCPTLLATLHEVFRIHGNNMSTRKVVQDHYLPLTPSDPSTTTTNNKGGNKSFLLKKGSYILSPAAVQHSSPADWGADAETFNPARFIKSKGGREGYSRAAFKPWGYGGNVCPGRHFATTAVLGFAALFVLRFEVRPVVKVKQTGERGNGEVPTTQYDDGRWELPRTYQTPIIGSTVPVEDVEVEIRPREGNGMGGVGFQWRVGYLSESS